MKEFSDIRRQQFLYPELYDEALKALDEFNEGYRKFIIAEVDDKYDLSYVTYFSALFDQALDRLSLEYTAGKPIAEVKALYPAAVAAFEAWCEADDNWYFHRHPGKKGQALNSAIALNEHTSYLQLLRLISLGVLLNEDDLLRKIAKRITAQRGEDTIIEELLSPFVTDPKNINEFYHMELYDSLIGAAWEEGEDSTACMQKFLKTWYKFYEGANWHNAHMRVGDNKDSPHWANYYGYWAWEAGALAYLYELDDSEYKDNILYPKDLVAWARKQGKPPKSYTPPAGEQSTQLSNTPNSVCYKSGTQQNPAKKSS